MEPQHHLNWKNPLRALSPTILPVLSSCPATGSCTQGWAIIVLQSRRLNVTFRNKLHKQTWSCFPLHQLIRAQLCTAALGLSLVYRCFAFHVQLCWSPQKHKYSETQVRMYRGGMVGLPMVSAALAHVSSAQLHPTHQHRLSAAVGPWQSPTALASACLGNTKSQCLEVAMTPVRRKWLFAGNGFIWDRLLF